MDKHLLEYIEIKDFKCFKDFKAEGFKRVNLICGKNNVGKTAFMEAGYINMHSINVLKMFSSITDIKYRREKLELINDVFDNKKVVKYFENIKSYKSKTNENDISFELINENGIKEYKFTSNSEEKIINANEFSYDLARLINVTFLDNLGLTNEELKSFFIEVQKKDKEETLYKYINEFDENILNFKILGGEKPSCKVIDREEYQDLSEFGDGLKHYISIICALYNCKDGYLFIDEIDNGIHYTQLDRIWEIILTISKEQSVQVFATTHSKECIESYARVSEKLEDEDISLIELGKDKDNILKAIVMDNKRFYRELENGNGVRGW